MGKTNKIYSVIITVLFLSLISFSFLNDLFLFYKVPESSKTENRNLAPKPVFDISNLDAFPKKYKNYFNDHFPFRDDLAFMNSLVKFFVFRQSPLPGTIELGKNGWLFYDQKELIVYNGKYDLSPKGVDSLVTELRDRTLLYKEKGIRFYVAFPPMKAEIYPEYLPYDYQRAPAGTLTDKVVNAIMKDSVIQYIDLKKALLDAKTLDRLYVLSDNHWNQIGAFYGYSAIINRMKVDFPEIRPMKLSDYTFTLQEVNGGNLANMIGLDKYLKAHEYYPEIKKPRGRFLDPPHKRPDFATNIDDYEVCKSSDDSTLPSIVIVRDSYVNSMMSYLDPSFYNTTYIFDGWRYLRNEEIIDDLKPDIVLLVIFEPHISNLVRK